MHYDYIFFPFFLHFPSSRIKGYLLIKLEQIIFFPFWINHHAINLQNFSTYFPFYVNVT